MWTNKSNDICVVSQCSIDKIETPEGLEFEEQTFYNKLEAHSKVIIIPSFFFLISHSSFHTVSPCTLKRCNEIGLILNC